MLFLGFHCLKKYIKVAFFRGTSLHPLPPGAAKSTPRSATCDIRERGELDEARFSNWVTAGEPPPRRVAVAVGADRFGARPVRPVSVGVETSIELRQLRYFIAVAEELHFGRAARRLHMSQSPLSRAIRELEHDLGLVLFVRTTRRVELTPAGAVLLDRSRRALAELDGAIIEARRTADPQHGVLGVGYGPFSRPLVGRFAAELAGAGSGLRLRLAEEVSPESLAASRSATWRRRW